MLGKNPNPLSNHFAQVDHSHLDMKIQILEFYNTSSKITKYNRFLKKTGTSLYTPVENLCSPGINSMNVARWHYVISYQTYHQPLVYFLRLLPWQRMVLIGSFLNRLTPSMLLYNIHQVTTLNGGSGEGSQLNPLHICFFFFLRFPKKTF